MKPLHTLVGVMLASAFTLTDAVAQQQLAGPWAHDANANWQTLYVSPNGDDANQGWTSADPFETIGAAVAAVDGLIAQGLISVAQTPSIYGNGGVTINLAPGIYTVATPIELPAFGVCIEAGRGGAGSQVVVRGSLPVPVFSISENYGPFDALGAAGQGLLPASEIRNLTIECPSNATGLSIDMRSAAPAPEADISVGVIGCDFAAMGMYPVLDLPIGIQIYSGSGQRSMRNRIVSNDFEGLLYAVDIHGGSAAHSDLIRSNQVQGCAMGVVAEAGTGRASATRPRILSNMIAGCGSHNFQPVGGLPIGAGVLLGECSGQLIGNTIAYTRNSCPSSNNCGTPVGYAWDGAAGIVVFGPSGSMDGRSSLVIANNLLFNTAYVRGNAAVESEEIVLEQAQGIDHLIVANDFDGTSNLVTPNDVQVGSGNVAIGDPGFQSGALGAYNLHLSAASLGIVNEGDLAFVIPGQAASFQIGQSSFDSNCALDADLDSRTARAAGALGASVRRGADQPADTQLRAPASASVDANGNVSQSSSGQLLLELDAPVGSTAFVFLSVAMPEGAEQQHLFLPGMGSLALGTDPAGFVSVGELLGTTQSTSGLLITLPIPPNIIGEAENYLQAWIFRPDGTQTLTNRLRLDQGA